MISREQRINRVLARIPESGASPRESWAWCWALARAAGFGASSREAARCLSARNRGERLQSISGPDGRVFHPEAEEPLWIHCMLIPPGAKISDAAAEFTPEAHSWREGMSFASAVEVSRTPNGGHLLRQIGGLDV